MAINFRMSYRDGVDYADLFPRINMSVVDNATRALKYSIVTVTIPAYSNVEQVIDLNLTSEQQQAPFFVELVDKNRNTLRDYASISQMEIRENRLIINRLAYYPISSIKVNLIFREAGTV